MNKNRGDFIADVDRYTNGKLADKYGVSKRTIRRWKAECRDAMPAPLTPKYDEQMVINADRALVLGDVEVPCHHVKLLELACEIAIKYNVNTLIINGDFVANDSFSSWAQSMAYKLSFKDETESAFQIIVNFLQVFDKVYCVTGNHERRLAHKVDGEITIAELFSSRTGVEFSEYAYCTLVSGGREILVAHQDNYSKQPLSVARELAAIYHKCIIAGHTHHQAQGFDRSGKYWIVDGGCARDPDRTAYKKTRVNTFPMWNLGFTLILGGLPFLVNLANSNFWAGEAFQK